MLQDRTFKVQRFLELPRLDASGEGGVDIPRNRSLAALAPSPGIGTKCEPPQSRSFNEMSSYPMQTPCDLC
jgi:hypothetical protein